MVALTVFFWGLNDDPFIDEYAYITQSFYADLFFNGQRDHPAWLLDFAFDLQPLPKYLIGPVLRAAHIRMPGIHDASRWYANTHYRFGPPEVRIYARIPFIIVATMGSLALFGCGLLIAGRRVGAIAAVLLTLNPLFRLHAHRAMSDVPCEAFLVAALGLALWGASRIWSGRGIGAGLSLFAAAGIASGLSIACKLNGLLAPMIIAAWCGLGMLVPRIGVRRRAALAAGLMACATALAMTVTAINPTLTCRPRGRVAPELADRVAQGPLGRCRELVNYRLDSVAAQRKIPKFYRDVVRTPLDKIAVVAVQGFGRFGPFGPSESDSVVRYQLAQDWGLVLWWPVVLVGILRTCRLGGQQLREGAPPTALALLIWALMSTGVVTWYLPLAWDRYLLPIQAPIALLGAVGLSAIWDRFGRKAVPA